MLAERRGLVARGGRQLVAPRHRPSGRPPAGGRPPSSGHEQRLCDLAVRPPSAARSATRSSLGVSARTPVRYGRRGRAPAATARRERALGERPGAQRCARSSARRSGGRASRSARSAAPRSVSARACSSRATVGSSAATACSSSPIRSSPVSIRASTRSATPSAAARPRRGHAAGPPPPARAPLRPAAPPGLRQLGAPGEHSGARGAEPLQVDSNRAHSTPPGRRPRAARRRARAAARRAEAHETLSNGFQLAAAASGLFELDHRPAPEPVIAEGPRGEDPVPHRQAATSRLGLGELPASQASQAALRRAGNEQRPAPGRAWCLSRRARHRLCARTRSARSVPALLFERLVDSSRRNAPSSSSPVGQL